MEANHIYPKTMPYKGIERQNVTTLATVTKTPAPRETTMTVLWRKVGPGLVSLALMLMMTTGAFAQTIPSSLKITDRCEPDNILLHFFFEGYRCLNQVVI